MGPQEPQAPPTVTPEPPVAPLAPVPAPQFQPVNNSGFGQPVGPSPMPVAPKSKKGLMIGLIAGGAALLLAILGIVLALTVFAGPSKDDFQKANGILNNAKDAYNSMSSLKYISTYGVTETEVEKGLEEIKDSKTKVRGSIDELGKSKVLNDKDVKESYAKLKDKMVGFDKSMDTAIEVYEKLMPVMIMINKANSSSTSTSSSLSTLTEVRKTLEGLDLKVDVNKTYAKGLIEQIKILETLIPKRIEMTNDYKKYDSAVTQQYYDAVSAIGDLDDDWTSSISKVGDEGEINKEMNNLGDVLYDKYLGIKR